jgi:hypothetical protein
VKSSPRRTESSETAAKDVGLEDSNSGRPRADEFVPGDITPSRFAAATRIPGEDIPTLKIYDGIDGIEPSSARVDWLGMPYRSWLGPLEHYS